MSFGYNILFSDNEVIALKDLLSYYPNMYIYSRLARIHLLIEYIRLSQLKARKPLKAPLEVLFAITDRCNSNCIHCWAEGLNHGKDLPTKTIIDIIDKLADAGVLHVTLSGGEPFLRSDIFDLIIRLKEYRIAVTILTNGVLLNEKTVNKLAKILDGDDIIQVSLDGPNEAVYFKQRGIKAFHRVIDGIKLLKNHGIIVRTNFVATYVNVDYLVDTYILSNELGVDIFSCSPVYPRSKGEKIHNRYTELKYLKELAKLNILRKSNNFKTMIYPVLPLIAFEILYDYYDNGKTVEEMPIFLPIENSVCSMNVEGKVFPGHLSFKKFQLGDLKEKSLLDIWNEAHEKGILPLVRDLSKTKCMKCKFLHLCRGGDTALTYRAYGTLDMPDPYCTLNPR